VSDPRPPARVIALVLNYNRPDDTIACVRSLRALRGDAVRVAVIDNGSSDDSVATFRSIDPPVDVLETGRNLGFGGGMNVGIGWALGQDAEFVWLLNNDTVVEPDALTNLLAAARADDRVGIVGSVVVDMDAPGRVQTWGGGSVNRWFGTATNHSRAGQGRLDHIVGVSMFVRRELLAEVPGFAPCYAFYLEDTDFSCEARRRGWSLSVAPDSVIRHRLGGTIGADASKRPPIADLLFAQGVGAFLARQCGPRAIVGAPLRLVGMTVQRLRRRQVNRIPGLVKAFAEGLSCGLRGGSRPTSALLDLVS
jgi:GT2 family glycosyltransferase